MTATMGTPAPAGHTSGYAEVLSGNERAEHLKDMDALFAAAIREEMLETQKFLAQLKRIGT